MTIAQNEITGDELKSKVPSKDYLNNYDLIFKKDKNNDTTNRDEPADADVSVDDNGD